jgi:hypothetical protein
MPLSAPLQNAAIDPPERRQALKMTNPPRRKADALSTSLSNPGIRILDQTK